ncbi:MAG: hypothetical protein QNK11_00635 [Legionella sp.]|nr:hypothetical protein [Legionella sp.]
MPVKIKGIENLRIDQQVILDRALCALSVTDWQKKVSELQDGKTVEDLAMEALTNAMTNTGHADSTVKENVKELGELLKGNGTIVSGFLFAVDVAAGIHGAISDVSENIAVKDSILEDQIKNQYVRFVVPGKGSLSAEEKLFKALMELIENTPIPNVKEFLGIRIIPPKKVGDPTIYEIHPSYKSDTGILEKVPDITSLDKARKNLRLHKRINAVNEFSLISKEFRKGKGKYWWYQKSHLDHINLRRALVMIQNTMIRRLQHPMDFKTRTYLDSDGCSKLCQTLKVLLNTIIEGPISDDKNVSLLGLSKKNSAKQKAVNRSINFTHQTSALIEKLRKAHLNEDSKSLPMADLFTPLREMLKTAIGPIFDLLYSDSDKVFLEKKDESIRTERLVELLKILSRSFKKVDVLTPFRNIKCNLPLTNLGLSDILNKNIETLFDVLIIFCHLSKEQRETLITALNNEANDPKKEMKQRLEINTFLSALSDLGEEYIIPLEQVLGAYPEEKDPIGRYFTGCLASLIDVFQIDMDTKNSRHKAIGNVNQFMGKEQVDLVNVRNQSYDKQLKAESKSAGKKPQQSRAINFLKEPYFYWNVSALLNKKHKSMRKLSRFFPAIGQLSNITVLFEKLHGMIQKDLDVLKEKIYLRGLDEFIKEASDIHEQFMVLFQNASDTFISPEMLEKLWSYADAFSTAISQIGRSIRSLSSHQPVSESLEKQVDDFNKQHLHAVGKKSNFGGLIKKNKRCSVFDQSTQSMFSPRLHASAGSNETTTSSETKSSDNESDDSDDVVVLPTKNQAPKNDSAFDTAFDSVFNSTFKPLPLQQDQRKFEKFQCFTLIELIDVCHCSMSYYSRGHKGSLLNALKNKVEAAYEKGCLKSGQLDEFLLDLIQVLFSYKKTTGGFFQAEFGYTKSAKAFIRALKSKQVNLVLPLAEMLSSGESDLSEVTDKDIINALINLPGLKGVPAAVDNIQESHLRCQSVGF